MKYLILIAVMFSITAQANDWDSSPNNWNNSPNNWDNSSMSWDNSPNNWENSTNIYNNPRIIRDTNGNAQGYAVPKDDGGVNFFDRNGQRKGYLPAR